MQPIARRKSHYRDGRNTWIELERNDSHELANVTTGMEPGVHPADLKRLGRHKSFDVLGEYLQFGDLFDRHTLKGVP
jgi:hypothetical protein